MKGLAFHLGMKGAASPPLVTEVKANLIFLLRQHNSEHAQGCVYQVAFLRRDTSCPVFSSAGYSFISQKLLGIL